MTGYQKYDKVYFGTVSGILLPLITGILIYAFSAEGYGLIQYFERLSSSGIITHVVSLCVFPNVIIFLIFNWLDMLNAAKGVLGITIIWAILVFAIKFFG